MGYPMFPKVGCGGATLETFNQRRYAAVRRAKAMMPQKATPPLILHVFPSFAVGGVQVRFAAIVNHFGRRWRHAVIAMDGDLSCRERLDPALDVEFPSVAVRKGDTLGNLLRFRRLLRRLRPDLLVTSNWGSIEWSVANLVPVVRQVHIEDGFGPDDRGGRLPRRVRLRRIVLRRRLVVLPSRTLWEIATRVWRLDPKRLCYVPNGIDLARFAGPPQPAGWPGPVVGTVAALRPEKNIARLLRAFALATSDGPACLVIAGGGPERPALEGLAQELGIGSRVRFTGHVADPAQLFKQLDVFAMSSDTEQMPLSLLEAMAAGLPVAATNVGDIRSMLAAANAPYVTALDDAALAAGLRALLGQAGLRQALGAANRVKAEQEFNQEAMFQAWAAAFDGTLGPAQPG
jgi:glycosyltransferase involved in cell wall biosynthesis